MKEKPLGFLEPRFNELASRGIEPSPATLRSTERELRVIAFKSTKTGGEFQSETSDPGVVCPEEPSLSPEARLVEGWVAGVPVVEGVPDSGWQPCEDGRVGVVIRVGDFPPQREWVRAMSYGGAHTRQVLVQAE